MYKRNKKAYKTINTSIGVASAEGTVNVIQAGLASR